MRLTKQDYLMPTTYSMFARRYTLGALLSVAAALMLAAGCGSSQDNVFPGPKFMFLDGPGGSPTTLNGISNKDTVAGFTTANGANTNFLSTAGNTVSVLNVGDPAAGQVTAVNSSGTAVGGANGKAFSFPAGGVIAPITVPGSTAAIAFGINDAGVIVGQDTVGANTPGFADVNGVFTTIIPTPTATVVNPQGVNNNGDVIGFYSADGTHQHGFLHNINTKQTTLFADPVTARTQAGGLVLTQFLGINDKGEAVGYYQTNNGSQFGFLYNLAKQTYTFLDEPKAAPVNGVQITQITGVSNSGEICGFYIDAAGVQHGFIATGATPN